MGIFDTVLKRNREIAEMLDFDLVNEVAERAYLKTMALDSVLNFVSRTLSTLIVKTGDAKTDYKLNVKPNKSMSATDFWQTFFYRLLKENEVLVITTDDKQMLIADDYVKREYAFYDDVFENVRVKEYVYERQFKRSEVLYLEYNNAELDNFATGLFNDYGELFGRMIDVSMRNNQIRGSMSVEQTGRFDEAQQTKLQAFIDKMMSSFKTQSVAIIPKLKGFTYEEYTNKQGVTNQSLEELDKMKKSLINDISRMVGVPSALVHGDMADLSYNLEAYRKLCVTPLVEKLTAELNAQMISEKEYLSGKRVTIQNVLKPNPFELAVQIDKIIASGFLTPNEARTLFELEKSDNSIMDEHYITKNYEVVRGGEADEATES